MKDICPLEFQYQLDKQYLVVAQWECSIPENGWIYVYDDDCTCQASTSQVTKPFHWELLNHPPCSSDLIPSDYSFVRTSEATLGNLMQGITMCWELLKH